MKINDNSSATSLEYNKFLEDKLRNISQSKEREIERLKTIYEKKVVGAKSEGESRYELALKRNDEMLAGVGNNYEEKLKSYSDSLSKTEKNIAQTELAFQRDHSLKMKNLKEQFANMIDDEFSRARENQKTVQAQMKASVYSTQDKSRSEQQGLESNARSAINALGSEYTHKVSTEERDFRSKLDTDKQAHDETLRIQKNEFKTGLDKKIQQGKQIEREKVKVQKVELDFLDNHQRDILTQKSNDFKIRYETMVKEHEHILGELKTNLMADMKKMLESTSAQKKSVADKMNDHFYRIETLTPAVTETEKELIVSLPVPEYEKENVHLSAHGRDLKLTLNRRYTDTMESTDGSTNRSTRNELFSKEFSTKDILNPKMITQKYEKGVLTFKIGKA